MINSAHPRDGHANSASRSNRLQRLAAFASKLRNLLQEPEQAMTRDGTDAGPYRPGRSATADLEAAFSQMAYDAGWVIPNFDWMGWIKTEEGQRFGQMPQALAAASENDLAKLLTALVRQDRFTDGTIQDALARGLLLAAAQRAEVLLSAPSVSEGSDQP